jgi:pyruvate formate lyase activating enzyme
MCKIGGFKKFSLNEYPQKVSAIIFLQGCNFRCTYCHNPQLVYPEQFEDSLEFEEIINFLKLKADKLEAIVITGGEPTLCPELEKMCAKIKELGYSIKINTNGTKPEVLKKLIDRKLVDYISMDIKAPEDKYDLVAGCKVDIESIKKSINLLLNSKIEYDFRTTICPELNLPEDLDKIKKLISHSPRFYTQECK